uniref:Secretin receptor n=1 Tax=Cyprinus carpio carpio TaxID=630221 RepID=A0A8C1BPF3_CYPCA
MKISAVLHLVALAAFLHASSHVCAIPPECDLDFMLLREEENCYNIIYQENLTETGSTHTGAVMKNCTENGWSEIFPPYELACGHGLNDSSQIPTDLVLVSHEYFFYVKIMYSAGYAVSLVSLSIALTVLCVFRKLHCTRNFIHMQLFLSFILRAIFIFIRDAALHYSQEYYHCNSHPPGCKVALFLSNYCILANYSWLLVEGHYLHSLINLSLRSQKKRLHWYILLGWGIPMLIIISWSLAKYLHQDEGCWETRDHGWIWWILRVPVIIFITINMLFFLSIIRTLVAKLKAPDMHGNEINHHRKLAKSTFLLVSLFGLQYVLFAFFPDRVSVLTFKIWNVIELALASTQGFIVALLYCFLNGEVQYEVQRRWRRWRMKQRFHGDPRVHHGSLSNSGLPLTQVSLLTRPSTQIT